MNQRQLLIDFAKWLYENDKADLSYASVDAFLSSLGETDGWIPVSERLPEEGTVIAYFPRGNEDGQKVATGMPSGKKVVSDYPNSTASHFEASHWMPLPKLPKSK